VNWIAELSAIVAVAAAVYAWRTVVRLRTAHAREHDPQLDRRNARGAALVLTVLDADIRLGLRDGSCQYAVLLSVMNGTLIPRAFTAITLRIRYTTASHFSGAAEVPLSTSVDLGGSRTGEVTLRLPLTLPLGQALTGWAHFTSPEVVPRDGRLDGYAVVMTGDAGERLMAEVTVSTIRQGDGVSAAELSARAPL
jgi:hypothetical protein